MIPEADVALRHDEVPPSATYPSAEEARGDSLDGNTEYDPAFLDTGWGEVEEALQVERARLEQASELADDVNEFEDVLDGELEDWETLAIKSLDVGVASLVLGLAAAGCVTTWSCRGHPGYASAERDFPKVRFYADPEHARLVRELAIERGCGFGWDAAGIFEVWAPSINETIAMAEAVIGSRHRFESLPARRLT